LVSSGVEEDGDIPMTQDFPDLNNPDYAVPEVLRSNVAITTLDRIYNWSRARSVWPMLFGLACCAIEMIATAAARYDPSRFGMEVMRPSPRQCDLMIVSGTYWRWARALQVGGRSKRVTTS
jgi:NADH:ubiquinone oxidoreductase subunit B-like Fe-S oxidoreductase